MPYTAVKSIAIVSDNSDVVPPLEKNGDADFGEGAMKIMHLCYAAIGFAVARWIFRRQALPVVDPVTRFRSQGLM